MASRSNKDKIMTNKNKLKNIRNSKIYFNDDLTTQERTIQKLVRIKVCEETEKRKQVKMGCQKLIIRGEVWKWN